MKSPLHISHIALLAVLAMLMIALPAKAVSADKLQSLSLEVQQKSTQPECISLSDSLYKMARKAGNHNAELLALYSPMKYHYYSHAGIDVLNADLQKLIDASLKYNITEYLYGGVSYKTTYLTNSGNYAEAISYQEQMLKFAKAHNHHFGMVLGHVSLGNIYRMRMQMANAINEYRQAINGYKEYKSTYDLGQCYIRIAECYAIDGQFESTIKTVDEGISETNNKKLKSSLTGFKAFSLFMLGKDSEFSNAYSQYLQLGPAASNMPGIIDQCLQVMKLIIDGNTTKAQEVLSKKKDVGFWLYVKKELCKRQQRYQEAVKYMQKLNLSLYGNSTSTYATRLAKMSAEINEHMQTIGKQRAENELSRLALTRTNLEIQKKKLQLQNLKKRERASWLDAENSSLAYDNQTLISKNLTDSIAHQRLRREAYKKEMRMRNISLITAVCVVLIIIALEYRHFRKSIALAKKLKKSNTKLIQNMAELQIANNEAQESDRMKTIFVQNISHELRTPLNAIVGFSQVLTEMDDQIDETEKADIIRQVTDNSQLLTTLINDILDLARVESGKLDINIAEVKVNDLCRRVISSSRSRLAAGVDMVFNSTLTDEFTILSDAQRITQVLSNLVTNAEKNTSHGSITLECRHADTPGMILFTVTDTGIGIPKEHRNDIFQMFGKLDTFKQGLGLGLSLSNAIIKALGGKLGIDTEYNDGARFFFTIPKKSPSKAAPQSSHQQP